MNEKIQMIEYLPADGIRQIMSFSQSVYYPLLTNPANQEGWPDVIAKELTDNLHNFLTNTYVTLGHISGEILLPLPPEEVNTVCLSF